MVNNVRWTEVPSLFGRGPTERVYATRIADDGTVRVGSVIDALARACLPAAATWWRIIAWALASMAE